jgi:hypothetical protein
VEKMIKRKQYLVDKKFQLKTTFSILGVFFLTVVIIISAISVNITLNNRKLNNIIIVHDNIVNALLTFAQGNTSEKENSAIRSTSKIHNENIAMIESIIQKNNILLLSIIIFIIVQSIVFFFILIRQTHKISGPIHVMTSHLKNIIQGKHPQMRPLRKGDEFQEFYALLIEAVKTLKKSS